jgi:PAS domain S-box-containing protein
LKSDPQTSLIPVVFLTSIKGDRQARIQAIEVGAEAFLSRPVDESELIAQIRAMQKIKSAAYLQQDEKENLTNLVALQTQALQQTHAATLNLLEDLHVENEARKENEAALRESEERFRTLFEKAPVAIYISRNGIGLYANQKGLQMFGVSSGEEITGRPVTDFLAPQTIEESRDWTNRRALGLPIPVEIETVALRPDGSRFPVQVMVDSVQLSDGSANLSFITDITERKNAQALQNAVYQIAAAAETTISLDELYPKIHQSISAVMPADNFYIALYDETKNLLRFPYFKNIKEAPFVGDVQLGRGLTAYVLKTSKSFLCSRALLDELVRQGQVMMEGAPCAIWLGVPLIVEGKTIGVMAVQHYSDLQAYGEREQHMLEFVSTQVAVAINRKRAEDALRESLAMLSAFVQHSPIYAYIKEVSSTHSCVLMASENFQQMVGIPAAEMVGKPMQNLFPPDFAAKITADDWTVTSAGEVLKLDEDLNGRHYTTLKFPISIGSKTLLAGYSIDITEQKRAEEAIRQLNASLEQRVNDRTRELREAQERLVRHEKLATLGQLAGGVGHELRNPLGVINSAVYYLKLVQPDADEKIKIYHSIIEQEVNTASRIINDLLDFGHIISPDRQTVSIPELVARVLTRFPVPPSIRVQLKFPASLPRVFADPLHLEQVLVNLITNACQAMKDGEDGNKLTISASLKKNQVAIAVKDTGTGITPETMQKLFEPLFTTKLRGIGLGLAVSRKLAEANGGRITVRSEPGKGSTFTVYLPAEGDS